MTERVEDVAREYMHELEKTHSRNSAVHLKSTRGTLVMRRATLSDKHYPTPPKPHFTSERTLAQRSIWFIEMCHVPNVTEAGQSTTNHRYATGSLRSAVCLVWRATHIATVGSCH